MEAWNSANPGYILIADDDLILLSNLEDLFKDDGFEVFTAGDGQTAWELYQQYRPDVVWLDYDMPGKTGEEVLAAIRSTDRHTLTVLVSGCDLDDDAKEKFMIQGADYVMPKTFDPVNVKNWIKSQLDKKHNMAQDFYRFGNSGLNVASMTLTVCGKKHELTARESTLLQLLLANKGMVVSFGKLFDGLLVVKTPKGYKVLANNISTLKQKLKKDTAVKIRSKYGEGYFIDYTF